MTFTVYILRTSSSTLYVGQTNNIQKRLREHSKKGAKSAKYLRSFESFKLAYTESCLTRSEALKREWQIKQWSKAKKEAFLAEKHTESVL